MVVNPTRRQHQAPRNNLRAAHGFDERGGGRLVSRFGILRAGLHCCPEKRTLRYVAGVVARPAICVDDNAAEGQVRGPFALVGLERRPRPLDVAVARIRRRGAEELARPRAREQDAVVLV